MVSLHFLLSSAVYKFPWDDTSNMPCLTGIPPHTPLISKMYIVLAKQGALEKQVVDALKLELYERNIRGGYNNMILMEFSS